MAEETKEENREEKEIKAKYDWTALKQEFFNSNYLEVSVFIRDKLGIEITENGWVREQTTGWTDEKKKFKQKQIEEVQKQTDEKLIEEFKITISELLKSKKILFDLDLKYLTIWLKLQDEKLSTDLKKYELSFIKNYPTNISELFKRLQIELGLPTRLIELQGAKEKPLVFVDLIREAEEILNNKEKERGK